MKNYKSTIYTCYLGIFVQAIVINLTPVLFIPLREQFGLAYGQLGVLVLVNFFTQVICDVVFSRLSTGWGFGSLRCWRRRLPQRVFYCLPPRRFCFPTMFT